MKKKNAAIIALLVLILAFFLFDRLRQEPLEEILQADQWVRLESVRAYGEANQDYELELTLEQVQEAVTGCPARKDEKTYTMPAPTIWCLIHTEAGTRIECAFAGDGTVMYVEYLGSRPCPTWKTDGSVYAALTGHR